MTNLTEIVCDVNRCILPAFHLGDHMPGSNPPEPCPECGAGMEFDEGLFCPNEVRYHPPTPDLATENATLRQENEQQRWKAERYDWLLTNDDEAKWQVERENVVLRSHLRDVVVPALDSVFPAVSGHAMRLDDAGEEKAAEAWSAHAYKLLTALRETKKLLSDDG